MESASSPVDQSHQHQHQHNEQLLAYERKWVEELESFKKLAVRLQQQAEPQQHALQTGCDCQAVTPLQQHQQPLQQQQQQQQHQQSQLPSSLDGSCQDSNSDSDQLTAAIQKAEALLAHVHAAAVQALSSDAAANNKLLLKQLRLQRNQAFDSAKTLLHKAATLHL